MKRFLAITILILSLSLVVAHYPVLIFDKIIAPGVPIYIDNPEISKVYYGNLTGNSQFYFLKSGKLFNLYLNILVPDNENSRTDFNIEVFSDKYFILNGTEYEWNSFYEKYGDDYYLSGPKLDINYSLPGTYFIKVSNPDNIGKYALAVGEIEYFSWKQGLRSLIILPKIKRYWFGESWLQGFNNIYGYIFVFLILVVIGVMIYSFRLIDNEYKQKRR